MPGWMDIHLPPPRSLCSDGFLDPHPPQVTLVVCVSFVTGLLGDHAPPHAYTKFPDQLVGHHPHPSSLNTICQKSVGPPTSASPVPQHLASRVMRWHRSDQGSSLLTLTHCLSSLSPLQDLRSALSLMPGVDKVLSASFLPSSCLKEQTCS